MSRSGWTLITIIGALITGLAMSHQPWKEFQKMRNDSHNAVQEAKNLETERAQLLHENARLDSPTGMEEIARDKGYRMKNESPVELNYNSDNL